MPDTAFADFVGTRTACRRTKSFSRKSAQPSPIAGLTSQTLCQESPRSYVAGESAENATNAQNSQESQYPAERLQMARQTFGALRSKRANLLD